MERAIDENKQVGIATLSQIEFEEASVEDLKAMIAGPEQQAKVYTCAEILSLNRDKFFDCLRKNFTKEDTASIIACDPRNTATKEALVRAMNGVFGGWRELRRRALNDEKPHACGGAAIATFPPIDPGETLPVQPHAPLRRRAFMDNTFGEEDML